MAGATKSSSPARCGVPDGGVAATPTAGALEAATRRGVPRASLSFRDLAFDLPQPAGGGEPKAILAPCSGHFQPGELVAIMGPSGCGKTTLMDMLAMKKSAPHRGEVFVNGRPRDRALFQRVAAYVGQEEKMPAHWKVREALEFNIRLKQRTNRKEADEMIDSLLDIFGLTDVAGTYIGGDAVRGISGGQRRRVMLGRGVAAQASILFADEPTSGLSATDAEACVQALRAITRRMGVLVLVVIHQPRREVAELFDTLLLLTSGPGRVCYNGPMHSAKQHFEALGLEVPDGANPADIMLDLVTPGMKNDESERLVATYDAQLRPGVEAAVDAALAAPGETVPDMLRGVQDGKRRVGKYAVPFCRQLAMLLKRQVRLTFRNPKAVGAQIGVPIGMGVLVGSLFLGIGNFEFGVAQLQFFFIMLTMLSLQSLTLIPVLVEQRVFMKYETSERLYTELAHMMSTMIVTVPLSLVGAALRTAIMFAFASLPADMFLPVMFWSLVIFFMFDAIYHCVSAAAPDAHQALVLALPFLVMFMLFNGLMITKATAPVFLSWLFEVSPTFYAIEALAIRMTRDGAPNDTPLAKAIVESLGYQDGEQIRGIVVIACLTLVARTLTCLALKFLNNIKR